MHGESTHVRSGLDLQKLLGLWIDVWVGTALHAHRPMRSPGILSDLADQLCPLSFQRPGNIQRIKVKTELSKFQDPGRRGRLRRPGGIRIGIRRFRRE